MPEASLLYGETRTYDAETGGLAEVGKSVDGQGIGKLNYAYNNTGALASIAWLGRSVAYNYDEFGRLKTVRSNEADWEYTYAPCGKKATVHNTRQNELQTLKYDGLGHLLSIEHKNVNENRIIFKIEYRLGPDGNRVGALERRQTAAADIATSWSYAYDALGRLASERRTIDNDYDGSDFNGVVDRNVTYEYDCDSNRKKVVDYCAETQEIYTHVPGTQRLDRVTYSAGKYKQYSWTPNGEMEREDYYEGNALESSQIYTWGFGGTLVEVRFEGGDNDGCKVNYIYDNENELIGRKVTLKTGAIEENERYLVDNLNPTGYSQRLAVVDLKTGHIRHEIFTDELAAETTVNSGTANTQFMHGDGLGSIRALTGKSSEGENLGTDADRHFYDYTAFGTPLRGDRSLTNYAFTGQMFEQRGGLQYNRSRFYNNSTGSWITCDPVLDTNNFDSPYAYVANSPIGNLDPSGMSLLEVVSTLSIVCTIAACVNVIAGFGLACWGAFMDDAEDDDEDYWLESCLGFVYQVGPITISAGRCTSIAPALGKCVRSLYFYIGFDVAYMASTYWKTQWARELVPCRDEEFFEKLALWISDKTIGAGMTIGAQLILTPLWILCQMMSCLNSPKMACDELTALNFLRALRLNSNIMKTVQATSVGTESYLAYYPFAKAKDLTGLSLYGGINFTGANMGICRGMTGFGEIFGFDVINYRVKKNTAFGLIWSGGFRAGATKGWVANVTLDLYAKLRI